MKKQEESLRGKKMCLNLTNPNFTHLQIFSIFLIALSFCILMFYIWVMEEFRKLQSQKRDFEFSKLHFIQDNHFANNRKRRRLAKQEKKVEELVLGGRK